MAGTFTHWMVAEEALDRYMRLPKKHPYFSTVLGLNHFVSLGAVGPDYPYLAEILQAYLKIHSWADRMHYENTGSFVRYGIGNLPDAAAGGFGACLAWLCGFAAHLVTDTLVHPVVQATVGPYVFNSGEHRHCELIQDSYIFHEIKGVELAYGRYAALLGMCSDPNDKEKIDPDLRVFWSDTLKMAHPTATPHFDKIDPDRWHENFLSKIGSAAYPAPVFRHIGEDLNLTYKRTDEITPEERQRFIDEVRLPNGKPGALKNHVFDRAVTAVVDTWERLFVDIENKNPAGADVYLRNWNLDTGVDGTNAYFWP